MMNISDIFITGALVLDDQTFDASGTWTKPTGIVLHPNDLAVIDLWGGGGGGRGTSGANSNATGGYGGDFLRRVVPVSGLPTSAPVVVGAGGAGGLTSSGDGGDSSFAGMTAKGGAGYSVPLLDISYAYARRFSRPRLSVYAPGDGVGLVSGLNDREPATQSVHGGNGGSYQVMSSTYWQGLPGQVPGGGGGASRNTSSGSATGANGASGRVRIRIVRGISPLEIEEISA